MGTIGLALSFSGWFLIIAHNTWKLELRYKSLVQHDFTFILQFPLSSDILHEDFYFTLILSHVLLRNYIKRKRRPL